MLIKAKQDELKRIKDKIKLRNKLMSKFNRVKLKFNDDVLKEVIRIRRKAEKRYFGEYNCDLH